MDSVGHLDFSEFLNYYILTRMIKNKKGNENYDC